MASLAFAPEGGQDASASNPNAPQKGPQKSWLKVLRAPSAQYVSEYLADLHRALVGQDAPQMFSSTPMEEAAVRQCIAKISRDLARDSQASGTASPAEAAETSAALNQFVNYLVDVTLDAAPCFSAVEEAVRLINQAHAALGRTSAHDGIAPGVVALVARTLGVIAEVLYVNERLADLDKFLRYLLPQPSVIPAICKTDYEYSDALHPFHVLATSLASVDVAALPPHSTEVIDPLRLGVAFATTVAYSPLCFATASIADSCPELTVADLLVCICAERILAAFVPNALTENARNESGILGIATGLRCVSQLIASRPRTRGRALLPFQLSLVKSSFPNLASISQSNEVADTGASQPIVSVSLILCRVLLERIAIPILAQFPAIPPEFVSLIGETPLPQLRSALTTLLLDSIMFSARTAIFFPGLSSSYWLAQSISKTLIRYQSPESATLISVAGSSGDLPPRELVFGLITGVLVRALQCDIQTTDAQAGDSSSGASLSRTHFATVFHPHVLPILATSLDALISLSTTTSLSAYPAGTIDGESGAAGSSATPRSVPSAAASSLLPVLTRLLCDLVGSLTPSLDLERSGVSAALLTQTWAQFDQPQPTSSSSRSTSGVRHPLVEPISRVVTEALVACVHCGDLNGALQFIPDRFIQSTASIRPQSSEEGSEHPNNEPFAYAHQYAARIGAKIPVPRGAATFDDVLARTDYAQASIALQVSQSLLTSVYALSATELAGADTLSRQTRASRSPSIVLESTLRLIARARPPAIIVTLLQPAYAAIRQNPTFAPFYSSHLIDIVARITAEGSHITPFDQECFELTAQLFADCFGAVLHSLVKSVEEQIKHDRKTAESSSVGSTVLSAITAARRERVPATEGSDIELDSFHPQVSRDTPSAEGRHAVRSDWALDPSSCMFQFQTLSSAIIELARALHSLVLVAFIPRTESARIRQQYKQCSNGLLPDESSYLPFNKTAQSSMQRLACLLFDKFFALSRFLLQHYGNFVEHTLLAIAGRESRTHIISQIRYKYLVLHCATLIPAISALMRRSTLSSLVIEPHAPLPPGKPRGRVGLSIVPEDSITLDGDSVGPTNNSNHESVFSALKATGHSGAGGSFVQTAMAEERANRGRFARFWVAITLLRLSDLDQWVETRAGSGESALLSNDDLGRFLNLLSLGIHLHHVALESPTLTFGPQGDADAATAIKSLLVGSGITIQRNLIRRTHRGLIDVFAREAEAQEYLTELLRRDPLAIAASPRAATLAAYQNEFDSVAGSNMKQAYSAAGLRYADDICDFELAPEAEKYYMQLADDIGKLRLEQIVFIVTVLHLERYRVANAESAPLGIAALFEYVADPPLQRVDAKVSTVASLQSYVQSEAYSVDDYPSDEPSPVISRQQGKSRVSRKASAPPASSASSVFARVLDGAVNHLAQLHLLTVAATSRTPTWSTILDRIGRRVALGLAARFERDRFKSWQLIEAYFGFFPQSQWSNAILHTLLSLLHQITHVIDAGTIQPVLAIDLAKSVHPLLAIAPSQQSSTDVLKIPFSAQRTHAALLKRGDFATIDFPEDPRARQRIRNTVRFFAARCMRASRIAASAHDTAALAQLFSQSFSAQVIRNDPAGIWREDPTSYTQTSRTLHTAGGLQIESITDGTRDPFALPPAVVNPISLTTLNGVDLTSSLFAMNLDIAEPNTLGDTNTEEELLSLFKTFAGSELLLDAAKTEVAKGDYIRWALTFPFARQTTRNKSNVTKHYATEGYTPLAELIARASATTTPCPSTIGTDQVHSMFADAQEERHDSANPLCCCRSCRSKTSRSPVLRPALSIPAEKAFSPTGEPSLRLIEKSRGLVNILAHERSKAPIETMPYLLYLHKRGRASSVLALWWHAVWAERIAEHGSASNSGGGTNVLESELDVAGSTIRVMSIASVVESHLGRIKGIARAYMNLAEEARGLLTAEVPHTGDATTTTASSVHLPSSALKLMLSPESKGALAASSEDALLSQHVVSLHALYSFEAIVARWLLERLDAACDELNQCIVTDASQSDLHAASLRLQDSLYMLVALTLSDLASLSSVLTQNQTSHDVEAGDEIKPLPTMRELESPALRLETMLQRICFVIARVFSPWAARISVFAWGWLVSSAPVLRSSIFKHMLRAWKYTQEKRLGIFADLSSSTLPASEANASGSASIRAGPRCMTNASVHLVWVDFIAQRLLTHLTNSLAGARFVADFCLTTLGDPSRIALLVDPLADWRARSREVALEDVAHAKSNPEQTGFGNETKSRPAEDEVKVHVAVSEIKVAETQDTTNRHSRGRVYPRIADDTDAYAVLVRILSLALQCVHIGLASRHTRLTSKLVQPTLVLPDVADSLNLSGNTDNYSELVAQLYAVRRCAYACAILMLSRLHYPHTQMSLRRAARDELSLTSLCVLLAVGESRLSGAYRAALPQSETGFLAHIERAQQLVLDAIRPRSQEMHRVIELLMWQVDLDRYRDLILFMLASQLDAMTLWRAPAECVGPNSVGATAACNSADTPYVASGSFSVVWGEREDADTVFLRGTALGGEKVPQPFSLVGLERAARRAGMFAPQRSTSRKVFSQTAWKHRIALAWQVSPELAFTIVDTFSHLPTAREELYSCLIQDPLRASHIGKAVELLLPLDDCYLAVTLVQAAQRMRVDSQNKLASLKSPGGLSAAEVARAIRFLNNLGYLKDWAPCTVERALLLLSTPYYVFPECVEYAIRSLKFENPDFVWTFLPQIIQLIRGPTMVYHAIEQYLRDRVHGEIVACHQVIWVIEAETSDEDGNKAAGAGDTIETKETADTGSTTAKPPTLDSKEDISEQLQEAPSKSANGEEADEWIPASSEPTDEEVLRECEVAKARALARLEKREKADRAPTTWFDLVLDVNPVNDKPVDQNTFLDRLILLKAMLMYDMTPKQMRHYLHEFTFFEEIVGLSGYLRKFNGKPLRQKVLQEKLHHLLVRRGVYLPTEPSCKVLGVLPHTAAPLQSAKRVPIIATFLVEHVDSIEEIEAAIERDKPFTTYAQQIQSGDTSSTSLIERAGSNPRIVKKQVIFKLGDDCRQDALALQVIRVCLEAFQEARLELFVFPYRITPNASGGTLGGVIECIPNAETRNDLGKMSPCSLRTWFLRLFGPPEGRAFQIAHRNFILSLAGYAVVSYILQAKDRHNGNIMIDSLGRVAHIDFGFIYETSPGGNLGFEPSFKLTDEMNELIGPKYYLWFQVLVVRGFLAVRRKMDTILSLTQPMLDSTLRCFNSKRRVGGPRSVSMQTVRARFFPDLDDMDAAREMFKLIASTNLNWRTGVYDWIQNQQQSIYYWTSNNADDAEEGHRL